MVLSGTAKTLCGVVRLIVSHVFIEQCGPVVSNRRGVQRSGGTFGRHVGCSASPLNGVAGGAQLLDA
jgi:hypothetical protein